MKGLLLSIIVGAILSASTALAQIQLAFSGGNGTPLSITVLQSVSFTVTAPASGGFNPYHFLLDGVGDVFGGAQGVSFARELGLLSFTVNSGMPNRLEEGSSGRTFGVVSPDDVFLTLRALSPPLQIGDTVTLHAGTTTTAFFAVSRPPPANGSYNAFIISNGGLPISTLAAPIPEPGSVALLVIGGAIGVSRGLCRRRHATARRAGGERHRTST